MPALPATMAAQRCAATLNIAHGLRPHPQARLCAPGASARPAASRRGPGPCRAAAEPGSDTKAQVPDTPPAKDSVSSDAGASSRSSGEDAIERLSADEIGAQMAELRAAAKEAKANDGLVQVRTAKRAAWLGWIFPAHATLYRVYTHIACLVPHFPTRLFPQNAQGVLDEVQMIKWPTIQSALLNTVLVVAIVAGTSVVLFAVNTALAELSREVYARL